MKLGLKGRYEIDQGFCQDTEYLFDEIAKRINLRDPLTYKELITRTWVSDTINYHASGSCKNLYYNIFFQV